MIKKISEKAKLEQKPRNDGVELENQFILRLPEEVAMQLKEALKSSNSNLKDRMSIQLDNNLRYGEVRFDHYLLHAKVVDLKTIDSKSFYKSADICQMMICKEEPHDHYKEESPNKGKKKDPNKVDKKYLWAHGITPPCKNVRKRRFRKTLKKKNVEAPEIEKEVERLLRIDNDAVKVEFEIIYEDTSKLSDSQLKDSLEGEEEFMDETMQEGDKGNNDSFSQKDINVEPEGDDEDGPSGSAPLGGLGEHDIFGEEVSSSEDEEDNRNNSNRRLQELDETSRLSADDSRMSYFSVGGGNNTNMSAKTSGLNTSKDDLNDYSKSLFVSTKHGEEDNSKFGGSYSNFAAAGYFDNVKRSLSDEDSSNDAAPRLRVDQIQAKISELRLQLSDIKAQRSQKDKEIASIQNPTLRQRMQDTVDNLASQMVEKELELNFFFFFFFFCFNQFNLLDLSF